MLFSEYFKIDPKIIDDYNAVDICLLYDLPLFVDPMLIFTSDKKEYKKLHNDIIKYFYYLSEKSKEKLSSSQIKAFFSFSEIPNNWLGYSNTGNKGLALGVNYSKFLYKNIEFAINTNNISKSIHIEKIMLISEGSGKDKISDLTTNLLKGFLLNYTENFALQFLKANQRQIFFVDNAFFDYRKKIFICKEYTLPFIYNEKHKREFILLTPKDIIREGEPAINRDDCLMRHELIRSSIDNNVLRSNVNQYIADAVQEYKDKQTKNKKKVSDKKIEDIARIAFSEILEKYPIIYDYYIKLMEGLKDDIKSKSKEELENVIDNFCTSSKKLVDIIINSGYALQENISAIEESKIRIRYFKYAIENCDGYKVLYHKNKKRCSEKNLQKLFQLVWARTTYQVDAEVNNGRGQADFLISKGKSNKVIIEFKLANNNKLYSVLEQVNVYENANDTKNSLIVIFYFSELEHLNVIKFMEVKNLTKKLDDSIFLIDCILDNKKSASIV